MAPSLVAVSNQREPGSPIKKVCVRASVSRTTRPCVPAGSVAGFACDDSVVVDSAAGASVRAVVFEPSGTVGFGGGNSNVQPTTITKHSSNAERKRLSKVVRSVAVVEGSFRRVVAISGRRPTVQQETQAVPSQHGCVPQLCGGRSPVAQSLDADRPTAHTTGADLRRAVGLPNRR